MNPDSPIQIRRAYSTASDARTAVGELRHILKPGQTKLILFFCSASYDLPQLAAELRAAFGDIPTIGCTSAGQIGPEGFTKGGISATSLAGDLAVQPYAINLAAADTVVPEISEAIRQTLQTQPEQHPFGLLLVDGLSLKEEQLASLLYRHLPQIPVVGGSAGDDLAFKQTHVYVDGVFRAQTAVFTLFTTRLPFRAIKFTHFRTTDTTLVVTRSDPEKRIVYEINGEPAACVYADLIGAPVAKLDLPTVSRHPFVLEIRGEQYLRSVGCVNADHSLTFYCAIEDGVVLSLGRTMDPVAAAETAFQGLRDELGEPAIVLGCDCVLRRLEFESTGLLDTMGGIMKHNQVVGFSTYGEQFDGLHVNQTFTGIAIGRDYVTP